MNANRARLCTPMVTTNSFQGGRRSGSSENGPFWYTLDIVLIRIGTIPSLDVQPFQIAAFVPKIFQPEKSMISRPCLLPGDPANARFPPLPEHEYSHSPDRGRRRKRLLNSQLGL